MDCWGRALLPCPNQVQSVGSHKKRCSSFPPKFNGKDQKECFVEILTQVIRRSLRLHLD